MCLSASIKNTLAINISTTNGLADGIRNFLYNGFRNHPGNRVRNFLDDGFRNNFAYSVRNFLYSADSNFFAYSYWNFFLNTFPYIRFTLTPIN